MGDDDRLKLDGDGFSREPMSEDELAKQRHMRHHYERNFLAADDFVKEMGIKWIVSLSKAAPFLVAIIAGGTVVGGGLAYLSQRGFF